DHVAASQRARLKKLIAANTSTAKEAPAGARANAKRADTQEEPLLQRAQALDKKWRALASVDTLLSALEANSDSNLALDLDPLAIPRLDPDRRVKPIEDLDELIDVFAHVLEVPEEPTEVERVLDGVSRLCDQRPDDFAARTGPLRKRALDRLGKLSAGPFIGCGGLVGLCRGARGLLPRDVGPPRRNGPRGPRKNGPERP